jgi:hypothetical protein
MLFVDFHAIGYAVPRGCCISMRSFTMWLRIETSGQAEALPNTMKPREEGLNKLNETRTLVPSASHVPPYN